MMGEAATQIATAGNPVAQMAMRPLQKLDKQVKEKGILSALGQLFIKIGVALLLVSMLMAVGGYAAEWGGKRGILWGMNMVAAIGSSFGNLVSLTAGDAPVQFSWNLGQDLSSVGNAIFNMGNTFVNVFKDLGLGIDDLASAVLTSFTHGLPGGLSILAGGSLYAMGWVLEQSFGFVGALGIAFLGLGIGVLAVNAVYQGIKQFLESRFQIRKYAGLRKWQRVADYFLLPPKVWNKAVEYKNRELEVRELAQPLEDSFTVSKMRLLKAKKYIDQYGNPTDDVTKARDINERAPDEDDEKSLDEQYDDMTSVPERSGEPISEVAFWKRTAENGKCGFISVFESNYKTPPQAEEKYVETLIHELRKTKRISRAEPAIERENGISEAQGRRGVFFLGVLSSQQIANKAYLLGQKSVMWKRGIYRVHHDNVTGHNSLVPVENGMYSHLAPLHRVVGEPDIIYDIFLPKQKLELGLTNEPLRPPIEDSDSTENMKKAGYKAKENAEGDVEFTKKEEPAAEPEWDETYEPDALEPTPEKVYAKPETWGEETAERQPQGMPATVEPTSVEEWAAIQRRRPQDWYDPNGDPGTL